MLKRIISSTSRCNGTRFTALLSKETGGLGRHAVAASQHVLFSHPAVAHFSTAPVSTPTNTVKVFDPSTLPPPEARTQSVLRIVREQIPAHKDAFYVVDLNEVAYKYAQWQAELPRVRPFYAVKCNDDPRVVQTLASLGAGFDCASKGEMSMCLGLGVAPADVIFAHPAKQVSHLHYARAKGVTKMTFDNEDEAAKIAAEHPGAELVLRILPDDSASVCRLGLKFGCPPERVRDVLTAAKKLNLNVIGVSYHVGSGNGDASSFAGAVAEARTAFNVAAEVGYNLRLLDIGGGFPGSEMGVEPAVAEARYSAHGGASGDNPYAKHPPFSVIARAVRTALDTHFPAGCGVDIIGEPGRYFVKSTHTLAVSVIAKRLTADEGSSSSSSADGAASGRLRYNYYINDGLYGSFNCVLYDHVTCSPNAVLKAGQTSLVDLDEISARLAARRTAVTGTEESIAQLGPDGTPIISDAVGLQAAVQLAETVAEDAQQREVVTSRKRIMMGGSAADEDEEEAASSSGYNAAAGAGLRSSGAAAAYTSTSSGSGSSSRSASASSRRGVSTSSSSSSVAAAAAALPVVHPTTIWGPTCDSIDKITDTAHLPEMSIGDWLVFKNMGAYTIAGSCKFNGFPLATKVYLHRDGSLEVQKEEHHE